MHIRTESLLIRFAILFSLFILVTLTLTGVDTYFNQRSSYKVQCEERLVSIARHLEHLVEAEGRVFADFQRYFITHRDLIRVPMDYDGDWKPAWREFQELFTARHPGRTLGLDITFPQMDDDVQLACATYMHRKWLSIFESTAKDLRIRYAYYLVPSDRPQHMYWVIDAVREEKVIDGKKYIELCTEVHEPPEKHRAMWEAWTTGRVATDCDTYDNEWGRTYAYYTAVHLDGVRSGIIGTEISIADVDETILRNALLQTAAIGCVLVLCVAGLLYLMYRRYILNLLRLQTAVRKYSEDKDISVATAIENSITGRDEISLLSLQTASMMHELDNYMKNLRETTLALDKEKERVDALNALANKDALTGIRNKTAYDKEVRRLAWAIEDKSADFGIAVINLEHLSHINDTYGHEEGNIAIRKLCRIVCTIFKHSPVFRIGGGEFGIILENSDLAERDSLRQQFNAVLDEMTRDVTLEEWERISASIGIAVYDPKEDSGVDSVFARAERAVKTRK